MFVIVLYALLVYNIIEKFVPFFEKEGTKRVGVMMENESIVKTERREVSDSFLMNDSDAFFVLKRYTEQQLEVIFSQETYTEDDYEPAVWLGLDKEELSSNLYDDLVLFSKCYGDFVKGALDKEKEQEVLISYFDVLVEALEQAIMAYNAETSNFQIYRKIVEGLLFINSLRIRKDDRFLISDKHPLIYAQEISGKEVENQVEEDSIASRIVKAKDHSRKLFRIFGETQVYELTEKNGNNCYQAYAFEKIENNTKILAIRLWEKIKNYAKRRAEKEKKLISETVKIAVLGKIEEKEQLISLCQAEGITVRIASFNRDRERGKYYFINEEIEEEYNLLYPSDMEKLFQKYSIVLFLDLNCFYKQFQERKGIREKNQVVNCRWLLERAQEFENLKDKLACYQTIYENVGLWLNSYNNDASARYEFDEQLYSVISNAIHDKVDVYLYIKYGDKVAGRSLHNSNICNDEYYDGKQLIVYKFAKHQPDEQGEDYKNFLKNESYSIKLNIWKIIKSIDNSYYKEILSDNSKVDIADVIKFKNSFCELQYNNFFDGNNKIIFFTNSDKRLQGTEEEKKIKGMMRYVLNKAFQKQDMNCVHVYLKNLIVQSIISNAECVSDLLLACLISKDEMKNVILEEVESNTEEKKSNQSQSGACFAIRKTVYSIIENLSDLSLRSMQDRMGYFLNDFRKEVCPRIDEEIFKEIMDKIHTQCKGIGYTDSRIYYNSKLDA